VASLTRYYCISYFQSQAPLWLSSVACVPLAKDVVTVSKRIGWALGHSGLLDTLAAGMA
jgi:hypothetical protein